MVRHIVFFKFKPEVSAADRAALVKMVRELPAKIPSIEKPEVGVDFVHSPRSYDAALSFGFASRTALQEYSVHPDHIPVVQRAKQICEAMAAVDFEI